MSERLGFTRGGEAAAVNPILDRRLVFLDGAMESTWAERETGYAKKLVEREDVRAGDIAIIVSNSGRNAAPIEMAQEMHARGVKAIAITNVAQSSRSTSRHASGKRLFELADIMIDNCIPEGDAVLPVPNSAQRIGPWSTVAGAAIVNSIMIEAASSLQKAEMTVPLLPSVNLQSGFGRKRGSTAGAVGAASAVVTHIQRFLTGRGTFHRGWP